MSKSRAKGTLAESALVNFLRGHGHPYAERRALRGNCDCGDVAGIPGVVIEVKNAARLDLAGWVKEAAAEAENDGAAVWFVVAKAKGVGVDRAGEWFAITSVAVMADLLAEDRAGDERSVG